MASYSASIYDESIGWDAEIGWPNFLWDQRGIILFCTLVACKNRGFLARDGFEHCHRVLTSKAAWIEMGNTGCGSTYPEEISRIVRASGASIGISHDGDADRVILCDEAGQVVDGDEILAIAAIDAIRRGTLSRNTLVATVMSNFGLDDSCVLMADAFCARRWEIVTLSKQWSAKT